MNNGRRCCPSCNLIGMFMSDKSMSAAVFSLPFCGSLEAAHNGVKPQNDRCHLTAKLSLPPDSNNYAVVAISATSAA